MATRKANHPSSEMNAASAQDKGPDPNKVFSNEPLTEEQKQFYKKSNKQQ